MPPKKDSKKEAAPLEDTSPIPKSFVQFKMNFLVR